VILSDWFDAPHSWSDCNAAGLAGVLDLVGMAARRALERAGPFARGTAVSRTGIATPSSTRS